MAEYATVSVENLVKIDPKIPLDRAALVGCAVTTGVGAVFNTAQGGARLERRGVRLRRRRAERDPGRARSRAPSASSRSTPWQPKLEMAKKFGATDTLLATPGEDPAKELKKLTGGGPDYAFECVGSGALAETRLQRDPARRQGGDRRRGASRPTRPRSQPMGMVFEEKTLQGSYFGSCVPRVDFPRMLQLYMAGKLKLDELITRRYSIDEAPQAFADLESGKNARGVIVF